MKVGEPTKLKKAIYLSASMFLGVLLSFIAHAFIEISYLRRALGAGQTVDFYGGCALPPWLRIGLLALGINRRNIFRPALVAQNLHRKNLDSGSSPE